MFLLGFLVDIGALPADFDGLAAVALLGRHELDAAVTVLVVVPIHEQRHPLAGLAFAGEWPVLVVGPVLDRAEKGFGVRIVVRHSWPGERTQHAQLFQPGFKRGSAHGVAVVGMEDQWLAAPPTDSLAGTGPAHQIGCNGWVFSLGDIPGHHLAAPDVDHQVEVQPHASHRGGQIGDVPRPHSIGAIRPQARH